MINENEKRPSEVLIIGIGGGSGSGKTTFIKAMKSQLAKYELAFISQDNYYIPRENQKEDHKGIKNFDLPTSIDTDRMVMDVTKLMKGEVVVLDEYTFNNDQKVSSKITVNPASIIIVEGLFVFHNESLRGLMDYKLFIDAKENLKVIRRIYRDRIERNYPLDDVLYRYENHVLPSFEKYILPYKAAADIIVNNHDSFDKGLDVIVGFIKSKMTESSRS